MATTVYKLPDGRTVGRDEYLRYLDNPTTKNMAIAKIRNQIERVQYNPEARERINTKKDTLGNDVAVWGGLKHRGGGLGAVGAGSLGLLAGSTAGATAGYYLDRRNRLRGLLIGGLLGGLVTGGLGAYLGYKDGLGRTENIAKDKLAEEVATAAIAMGKELA